MNLNWSLKELYPSFNSIDFKEDIEKLSSIIDDINSWAVEVVKDNRNLVDKLEKYIDKFTNFTEIASKLGAFIELSISVNTKNSEALKYSDIIEKKINQDSRIIY